MTRVTTMVLAAATMFVSTGSAVMADGGYTAL